MALLDTGRKFGACLERAEGIKMRVFMNQGHNKHGDYFIETFMMPPKDKVPTGGTLGMVVYILMCV